jgi:hypothetical protein
MGRGSDRFFAATLALAVHLGACGGKEDVAPRPGADGGPGAGGSDASGGSPGAGGSTTTGGAGSGGGAPPLPPAPTCPTTANACTPRVLDSGVAGPGTFHVQDGYLYWRTVATTDGAGRNPNTVLRLRLPDGAPEVVTTLDAANVAALTVDSTHVYVTTSDGLARAPLSGGEAEYVAAGVPAVQAVVDEQYAYFTEIGGQGAVVRVLKTGGAVEPLVSEANGYLISADDTHVYWTTPGSTCDLMRAPKTGGAAEPLLTGIELQSQRLLVTGGFAYLSVAAREATFDVNGRLLRVPVAGGAATDLATFVAPIGSFGADAAFLYVGTCPTGGGPASMLRVPIEGGPATPIATGGSCIAGATVDATTVYFSDLGGIGFELTGNGSVLAAAKCGCP